MDTRTATLVSIKPMLMQLYQHAMDRYQESVMDYLTPKKLNQLAEVYLSDELARRMMWAEHDDSILEECIQDIFSRAPWNKGDHSLLQDIRVFVYEPMQVMLYRLLDDHGIVDRTPHVWHAEPRPRQEFLLINEGDYRIHVWNRLSKNNRRTAGLHWAFDHGLYGFRITQDWHLPIVQRGMALDD